jgi:hypothetical protein
MMVMGVVRCPKLREIPVLFQSLASWGDLTSTLTLATDLETHLWDLVETEVEILINALCIFVRSRQPNNGL